MRIAVTGGSGKLGRVVVNSLALKGHKVINLDLYRPTGAPPVHPNVRFVKTDVTDFGQTVAGLAWVDGAVSQPVDAVVHLAAIPAPGITTNAVVFQMNMVSTHNVFEACRFLRIKNIVWASSETVLGIPMAHPSTLQSLVPVDESVSLPQSSYSMSKYLGEKMAEQYARWDPELKVFGLRFSNVMAVEDYEQFESWQSNPGSRSWNLWAYIDARDAAEAVLLALLSPLKGADVFTIANPDSVTRTPNSQLLAQFAPGTKMKAGTGEHDSLLSIEKAKRVLGYKPASRWRGKL
ncbi:hypothetical protein HDU93_008061 [Gonapodya sp. JEL0774]|nr:hypothetical protein HDU93_008061 [Gonapodya sp. JEL0774]